MSFLRLYSTNLFVVAERVNAIYVGKSEKDPEFFSVFVLVDSKSIECVNEGQNESQAVELANRMIKQIEDWLS